MSEREPIVAGWINEYPDSASRVMIDAGANIGEHTITAAQRFQHVYAVEPHDETFKKLCNATSNLDNVTPVYRAIDIQSDSCLMADEHLRTINLATATALRPDTLMTTVPMAGLTFDQLWEMIRDKGQTVGLVKCDIEGAEDFVWDHSERMLDDNRDWLWIILELHHGVNMARLYNFFVERGYRWSSGELHHAGHYLIKKAAPISEGGC